MKAYKNKLPDIDNMIKGGGRKMDLNKSNFDKNDAQANKLAAVLSYLGILVVVTLIIAPDSKFARYHANQGICLLITGAVYSIASRIIIGIFKFIPIIGALVSMVLGLIGLLFLVLMIIGIVNVVNGETKPLPIIGDFQILK